MAFTPSCTGTLTDVYEITLPLVSYMCINTSPLHPSQIHIGHMLTLQFIPQTKRRSRCYLFRWNRKYTLFYQAVPWNIDTHSSAPEPSAQVSTGTVRWSKAGWESGSRVKVTFLWNIDCKDSCLIVICTEGFSVIAERFTLWMAHMWWLEAIWGIYWRVRFKIGDLERNLNKLNMCDEVNFMLFSFTPFV